MKIIESIAIALPSTQPILTRSHSAFFGDLLNLSCTSCCSNPKPNISWTINGQPIKNPTDQTFNENTQHQPLSDRLYNTTSRLSFSAAENNFPTGSARIRCTVTISDLYSSASETTIKLSQPSVSQAGNPSPLQSKLRQ